MNIIKRNGKEVTYDADKIIEAVKKANNEVREKDRLLDSQVTVIEEKVRLRLKDLDHEAGVEEIQDYVIVHELTHTVHMDHSRQFYADLARILPDYKAREASLHEHNTILTLI